MPAEDSFLVEDFIQSITTQLDRVQDILRLKAVNRPLTYALKDLQMELKVFVEMDRSGSVRFRTGGPNEEGASVVHLSFTTITKPMIEENTISMASARSPSLEEIGMAPDERQRLEHMGVRNLVQLNRLGNQTGFQTISRLVNVPTDRLHAILQRGRPRVDTVSPEFVKSPAGTSPQPVRNTVNSRTPSDIRPVVPPKTAFPPRVSPMLPHQPLKEILRQPNKMAGKRVGRPIAPVHTPDEDQPISGPVNEKPQLEPISPGVVRLTPNTRRLSISGENLLGMEQPPIVRLNDQVLPVHSLENHQMVVDLPQGLSAGSLEVEMPGGESHLWQLEQDESWEQDECHDVVEYSDSWAPEGGE